MKITNIRIIILCAGVIVLAMLILYAILRDEKVSVNMEDIQTSINEKNVGEGTGTYTYDVVEMKFAFWNHEFIIPQVEKMKDEAMQKNINKAIVEEMREYFRLWYEPENEYNQDVVEQSLDYRIIVKNKDDSILSILITDGYYMDDTLPHPNCFSFGITIDIKNEKIIHYGDVIDFGKNNEKFVEMYNRKEYTPIEGTAFQYLNTLSKKEQIQFLNNNVEVNSIYFFDTGIGVIFNVPYAVGSYFIAELSYDALRSQNVWIMKTNNDSDDISEHTLESDSSNISITLAVKEGSKYKKLFELKCRV
jgi:hypothetical protein